MPRDPARAAKLEAQSFDNHAYHCHDLHDASACTRLGLAYAEGVGVSRSLVNAVSAFELSCGPDAPDAEGCYRLGRAYDEGAGVTRDARKAAKLYGQACAAGYLDACPPTPKRR